MNTYKNIELLRSIRKISKKDLALATGQSTSNIGSFLTGKSDISAQKLCDVLEKLGIRISDIIKDELMSDLNEGSSKKDTTEAHISRIYKSLDDSDRKTILKMFIQFAESSSQEEVKTSVLLLKEEASRL